MGNRFGLGVLIGVLATVLVVATIGAMGYTPYAYGWHRPWGFGFFPFFPFLFILLWFVLLRGFFWRGRYGGWHGYYDEGVPPRFEEWHRRAHQRDAAPPAPPTSTSGITA